jgi:hypothetical protein
MTKIKSLLLMTACFAAGLLGANVQPILSGSGKLLFPETTPSANLSAASGALTIAAGGTNQSITLTPRGTGAVGVGTSGTPALPFTVSNLGPYFHPGAGVVDPAGTAWAYLLAASGGNNAVIWDSGRSMRWGVEASIGGGLTELMRLTASGKLGPGGNTNPSYPVDATGDINTSTTYRVGGTAGLSGTYTVRNSLGTGTCTLTYAGGVLTAETC